MKTAIAIRKSGYCYDVTYSDSVAMDMDVPYAYLLSLAKAGYVVEVDQRQYRPEGEPEGYLLHTD